MSLKKISHNSPGKQIGGRVFELSNISSLTNTMDTATSQKINNLIKQEPSSNLIEKLNKVLTKQEYSLVLPEGKTLKQKQINKNISSEIAKKVKDICASDASKKQATQKLAEKLQKEFSKYLSGIAGTAEKSTTRMLPQMRQRVSTEPRQPLTQLSSRSTNNSTTKLVDKAQNDFEVRTELKETLKEQKSLDSAQEEINQASSILHSITQIASSSTVNVSDILKQLEELIKLLRETQTDLNNGGETEEATQVQQLVENVKNVANQTKAANNTEGLKAKLKEIEKQLEEQQKETEKVRQEKEVEVEKLRKELEKAKNEKAKQAGNNKAENKGRLQVELTNLETKLQENIAFTSQDLDNLISSLKTINNSIIGPILEIFKVNKTESAFSGFLRQLEKEKDLALNQTILQQYEEYLGLFVVFSKEYVQKTYEFCKTINEQYKNIISGLDTSTCKKKTGEEMFKNYYVMVLNTKTRENTEKTQNTENPYTNFSIDTNLNINKLIDAYNIIFDFVKEKKLNQESEEKFKTNIKELIEQNVLLYYNNEYIMCVLRMKIDELKKNTNTHTKSNAETEPESEPKPESEPQPESKPKSETGKNTGKGAQQKQILTEQSQEQNESTAGGRKLTWKSVKRYFTPKKNTKHHIAKKTIKTK